MSSFDKSIIAPVELQEFLFATQEASKMNRKCVGMKLEHRSELEKDIREILRLHRFSMFTWLLQVGVKIPHELLADQMHAAVGSQYPDQEGRNNNGTAT